MNTTHTGNGIEKQVSLVSDFSESLEVKTALNGNFFRDLISNSNGV